MAKWIPELKGFYDKNGEPIRTPLLLVENANGDRLHANPCFLRNRDPENPNKGDLVGRGFRNQPSMRYDEERSEWVADRARPWEEYRRGDRVLPERQLITPPKLSGEYASFATHVNIAGLKLKESHVEKGKRGFLNLVERATSSRTMQSLTNKHLVHLTKREDVPEFAPSLIQEELPANFQMNRDRPLLRYPSGPNDIPPFAGGRGPRHPEAIEIRRGARLAPEDRQGQSTQIPPNASRPNLEAYAERSDVQDRLTQDHVRQGMQPTYESASSDEDAPKMSIGTGKQKSRNNDDERSSSR